jgi:SpoVK/Ycf46/Vps4 family AAA+-type ATPase
VSGAAGQLQKLVRVRGDVLDLLQQSVPDVGLDAIVLRPDILTSLRRVIDEQKQRSTLAEHGYRPICRLLFTGPPGTGKTLSAGALAYELELPLRTVRLDSVISRYMGETASKLRLIFDEMSTTQAVYLFDEFDALGAERDANHDVGEMRRILNSFLLFLDAAPTESVLIAATNHPQLLDRALFRRFDQRCQYSLPAPQDSIAMLQRSLRTMRTDSVDWQGLATDVAGLSHAELVKAAEDAAKSVLLAGQIEVDQAGLRSALACRLESAEATRAVG